MALTTNGRCIGGPYASEPLSTDTGATVWFTSKGHKGQYVWHDEENAYVWHGTGQNQPVFQGD